jgi:hypothetical protein
MAGHRDRTAGQQAIRARKTRGQAQGHGHGVELSRARDVTARQLEAAGVSATGGQAARDALSMIGIDVSEIQRRADATFGPGTFRFPRPAFTPGAKMALELTLREATDLGHERIDTEDMLLGLLAETETESEGEGEGEGEGVALAILSALDVDAAALRQSVLDRLAQPSPPHRLGAMKGAL